MEVKSRKESSKREKNEITGWIAAFMRARPVQETRELFERSHCVNVMLVSPLCSSFKLFHTRAA